jgi:spore coat polysaccharide biosynthesis protein SpsF
MNLADPPAPRLWLVVQARMGSSRLPGKALMALGPAPVLPFLLKRLQAFPRAHATLLATTERAEDRPLLAAALACGATGFAGPVDDVLGRFVQALAAAREDDAVVRLTGDNPFVDLDLLARCLEAFAAARADYTAPVGCALGTGAEVIRMGALREAARSTREPWHREHVTPFLREHPERFRLAQVQVRPDRSGYRLTLDTAEDLALGRILAQRLGPAIWTASPEELIACMDADPALAALNRHVVQKGPPS